MFFDVRFDGEKVLGDEVACLLIFVGLGIQPSAGASCRRGAEIQQDGPAELLCGSQRLINVFAPAHGHNRLSLQCRQLDAAMLTDDVNWRWRRHSTPRDNRKRTIESGKSGLYLGASAGAADHLN